MNLTCISTRSEDLPVFIARCPQIGIASQGSTEDEAFNNLKEATRLYLEEVTDPSHKALELA